MIYLFGFLLTVCYLPWLPRSGVELRWSVIGVGIFALMFAQRRAVSLTGPVRWFAAFYLYAAVSMLWSDYPMLSFGRWCEVGMMAFAFYLGAALEDVEDIFTGMIMGVAASAVLLPFQIFGISPVEQWSVPAGLFVSKLQLVEVAVPLFFVSVARGWKWRALICASAAILPSSRGAWLALIVTGLIAVGSQPRRRSIGSWIGGALAVIVITVGLAWMNVATIEHRLVIWSQVLSSLTWFGHGLGTYLPVAGAAHAHNDYLEIFYELGPIGLLLFATAVASLPRSDGWPAIISILLLSVASFPLQNPASGFLFALLAGWLAGADPRVRGADDDERSDVRFGRDGTRSRNAYGYPRGG